MIVVSSALTFFLHVNVPHVHHRPGTSLHVMTSTRPSLMLVLQATNTGVRRPGYEVSNTSHPTMLFCYPPLACM